MVIRPLCLSKWLVCNGGIAGVQREEASKMGCHHAYRVTPLHKAENPGTQGRIAESLAAPAICGHHSQNKGQQRTTVQKIPKRKTSNLDWIKPRDLPLNSILDLAR